MLNRKTVFCLFFLLALCLLFASCGGGKGSDATTVPDTEAPETTAHVHVWDEGTVTVNATCTTPGTRVYTCSCGETRTETIDAAHAWDEGRIIAAPTCVSKGATLFTCTVCGTKQSVDIPATGVHAWVDTGIVTTVPTEAADGEMIRVCSTCSTEEKHPYAYADYRAAVETAKNAVGGFSAANDFGGDTVTTDLSALSGVT